jgi:DNA replication ATP-dependent helicase Dna2
MKPHIVGLLSQIKRFILIGDHRQLPAVVTQSPEDSVTTEPLLLEIGLPNLRNSLFERLYQRCRENNWTWAFDQLSYQGRMHQEIVVFPSQFFYDENLNILPFGNAQLLPLTYQLPKKPTELEQLLATKRLVFLPTTAEFKVKNSKINLVEAQKVGEIIKAFQRIYDASGIPFHNNSLGVITPYRAQIAQILQVMNDNDLDNQQITVDTVERYQGGARDIIVISLCTNSLNQVKSMISLSSDGIDRKLNVALTRARKHLVVLGNPDLLAEVDIYRALMLHMTDVD